MNAQTPVTPGSGKPGMETPAESPAKKYSDVIVVIPSYNEELVIGSIVLKALQQVEKVIVVDDGSQDRTAEVAAYGGAEVIRLETNTGKAHALCAGLKRARDLGCTAAVTLDGDGQHKTREIRRVVTPVIEGNADLVIGSRFLTKTNGVPFYRRVGQKTLDVFTEIGSGQKCTDTQSGFRAFSQRALDNLNFESTGYNIESDMIAHFASRGLTILEVPTTVRYEVPHKHKKNPVTHGLGVLARIINLISYRRPLLAFGIPGFIMIIAGMIAEIWVFAELVATDTFHYVLAIGSAFVLILGMLLVIAGLILNALVLIIKAEKE
jgi:glycosyltransferase involved in cell wall biosynthesis